MLTPRLHRFMTISMFVLAFVPMVIITITLWPALALDDAFPVSHTDALREINVTGHQIKLTSDLAAADAEGLISRNSATAHVSMLKALSPAYS